MNDFKELAIDFMEAPYTERTLQAFFGVSLVVMNVIWQYIQGNNADITKQHLIWTLYFLKHNPSDEVNKFKVSTKTWKKKVWLAIPILNEKLPKLPWNERIYYPNSPISCVLDVTRTQINQPSVDSWNYYSFKDKFYALKAEIAVSYRRPYMIIWANCGFRGAVSDITIARSRFIGMLTHFERVLADLGYRGEQKLVVPIRGDQLTAEERQYNYEMSAKRQIIERVNKRLKIFKVVKFWTRKDLEIHELMVLVVCKITNIIFEYNPL